MRVSAALFVHRFGLGIMCPTRADKSAKTPDANLLPVSQRDRKIIQDDITVSMIAKRKETRSNDLSTFESLQSKLKEGFS